MGFVLVLPKQQIIVQIRLEVMSYNSFANPFGFMYSDHMLSSDVQHRAQLTHRPVADFRVCSNHCTQAVVPIKRSSVAEYLNVHCN